MDDIELAMGVAPEIGRLYKEAKTFSSETPILALSFLRGLAVSACKFLDRDLVGQTLEEKIQNLDRQGMLNPRVRRHLKVLQLNGNKGVHPESYDFVTLDFPVLASEALTAARSLIEYLYEKSGRDVPIYEVAPVESGALKEMCVQAMLARDIDAMNQAGSYFQERADREKGEGFVGPDGYPHFARGDIDQAMFWYKQAADAEHPNAMYQYGHYLTQHRNVTDDQLHEGQRYIAGAARGQHADALVYVGNSSLQGLGIFERDKVYAREVFMDAARQGHPMALTQLGAMHALGSGGEADPVTAAKYTLEAARAGNPQAQFNLCTMYLEGAGVPKDRAEAIVHLQNAAAQGHPGAIYNLATFIEVGLVPGRQPEEAEAEYEAAMQHREFRARSALYAAQLIEFRSKALSDLLRAASHLQLCYSIIVTKGDPHNLLEECLKSCRKVVGRIRSHINAKGPDAGLNGGDVFTSALFSNEFVPVLDREERLAYLMDVMSRGGHKGVQGSSAFLMREACLRPQLPLGASPQASATSRSRNAPLAKSGGKVGRNEPCPCGSGAKSKHCHGK
ncbi:SEL1-like repeat protein [Pseudomonas sp. P66]|uniref:SEL1-like repeat protein n=1 Tax=Pseudomonas arcuscaelestis TaxID=2710591 RepID=A0ABS2BZC7_9PSED|nr:tetratricopeptide repeat protein [Pseudomonas arcuscaelestis]MBM5458830.1 SEL1-like repeat protein [Pseudomonas arcuscaelestis]